MLWTVWEAESAEQSLCCQKGLSPHLSALALLSSPARNTQVLPKIMLAKLENNRFEVLILL